MSHLIIDEKTRVFLKSMAVESLEMDAIHEALEDMPNGSGKTSAETLIDNLGEWLNDYRSDFEGQMAAIKTAVGL
jgi:hypothetical protein